MIIQHKHHVLKPGLVVSIASLLSACVSTPIDGAQSDKTVATTQAAFVSPAPVTPSIAEAPDREAILETLDRFFEALATGNDRVIDILVAPEALSVTIFPEEPGRPTRYGKAIGTAEAMRAGGFPKIEEPYWDPIVLQRKSLAVVWAPYEVWVNERLSHCGIDVFTLSQQKTAWRIDTISWTQEPSACEELWPDGRSVLRPGMFNDPE